MKTRTTVDDHKVSWGIGKVRFRFRTALVLTGIVAIISAIVGSIVSSGVQQNRNIEKILAAGGRITYENGNEKFYQRMLRAYFGDTYFATTYAVDLKSNLAAIELVKTLPDVRHLGLIDCHISSDTVGTIANLRQVKSLSLLVCTVPRETIPSLKSLTNIESLTLSSAFLNEDVLLGICELVNLSELILNSYELTGKSLRHLKLLPSLTHLHLMGLPINDDDLEWLAGNLELVSLELDGIVSLTDSGIVHLSKMTSLRALTLVDTSVTFLGIESLKKQLPHCTIRHVEIPSEDGTSGE